MKINWNNVIQGSALGAAGIVIMGVMLFGTVGCTTVYKTGHFNFLDKFVLDEKGKKVLDEKGIPKKELVLDKNGKPIQYYVWDEIQQMKGGGKGSTEKDKKSLERKSPWKIEFEKLDLSREED